MKKKSGLLRALRHDLSLFDDAIATVIIILLVCSIACAFNGTFNARADPHHVSLTYTQRLENGTMMKHYETNASGARMYINNNPAARNATYDELIRFILSDDVDQIRYDEHGFTCIDYAVIVHDRAEGLNISAGVITCDVNGSRHALNVFNTTDRGPVYIDCTGARAGEPSHNYDKIARIDGRFRVEPVVDISPHFYVNDEDDIVTNVRLFW